MGFIRPDAGHIDRHDLPPASIGYLPERAFYPVRFTIREYMVLIGRLAGLRGRALQRQVDRLLRKLGLHTTAGQRLSACSRGMLQRLGLAQALLGHPPLVLLDEPARGLDPAGQKFMRDQILELHEAGVTVVLSSHHLDEVSRICTHVGVLSRGRLALSGELEALLASPHQEPILLDASADSAPSQVRIITSPIPDDLASALMALAPGIVVSEQRITLSGEALPHKARVLRLLLDAQVDVQRLATQRATLEDLYLEATGE
jgi:ABC-2 type transport system ATP-binding protein